MNEYTERHTGFYKRKIMSIYTAIIFLSMLFSLIFPGFVRADTTYAYYSVSVYDTNLEGLALKEAPDIDSTRYFLIPENTILTITQISDNGWGYTEYNGITGWVYLKYTKVVGDYYPGAPTYGSIEPVYYTVYNTAGEGLEQRCRPSTESSTFGPIYDGSYVYVQAIQGDWAYVYYNGHYGWCYLEYLKISDVHMDPPFIDMVDTVTYPEPVSRIDILIDLGLPDEVKKAYLHELQKYQKYYYDVNTGESLFSVNWKNQGVSFYDITGDGIPEMFCIYKNRYSVPFYCKILSYQNGSIAAITRQDGNDLWFFGAGNSGSAAIITIKNDNKLYFKAGNVAGGCSYDMITEYEVLGNELVEKNYYRLESSYDAPVGASSKKTLKYIKNDIITDPFEIINEFERTICDVDSILMGELRFWLYDMDEDLSDKYILVSYEDAISYLADGSTDYDNSHIKQVIDQVKAVLARFNEMDRHGGCASFYLEPASEEIKELIGYFDFGFGPSMIPILSRITDCNTIEDVLEQRNEYFSSEVLWPDEGIIDHLKEYEGNVYLGWGVADQNSFDLYTLIIESYDENRVIATCEREYGGDDITIILEFVYNNNHLKLVSMNEQ